MAVKVDRSQIPLLVVGVGGTGKDIALSIKQKFIERFNNLDEKTLLPPRTAFLVIDADHTGVGHDPNGITGNEHCDITCNSMKTIFEQKSFTPEEQVWINPNLTKTSISDGAGGIRQVGRFQLFRNMNTVKDKLEQLLHLILGADANNPPTQFSANILICGSLSGGTGSGTALDMAYIVRHLIKDKYDAYSNDLKIYGMFLMPQCILQKIGNEITPSRHTEMEANGFAAMKEIDYWMRQDEHQDELEVKYPGFTAKWNFRPFDYLGYLGHTWEDGMPINDSYEVAINKIAELFLLLSTETPQAVNGVLARHTVYSSLSNARNEMSTHQDRAPYPVSAWAMSIGTSEYSSFENGIRDFEVETTLKQVLNEQYFDPKTGEEISKKEADANNIPVVLGTLGLKDVQDKFFENLKTETQTEDDFKKNSSYPFTEDMFTADKIEATQWSYVEDVRNYYLERQDTADNYYKERFDKIRNNFKEEATKAITAISCGPIGFLSFLDKVYIPEVTAALDEAIMFSKEQGEGILQANEYAKRAEESFAYLRRILRPGLNPQLVLARARWNDHADIYKKELEDLSRTEWEWRCMKGKAAALKDFQAWIRNYRDNLDLIIDHVKSQEERVREDNINNAGGTSLVSFAQMRNYLAGGQLPDSSVARARDQVLLQIAELSFSLPRTDLAESFEVQNHVLAEFQQKVRTFTDSCFSAQALTNMDRLLDAAVQGTNDTPQNYMATQIAPQLANAAKPMLHLKTAAMAIPAEFYEYHHIAIPSNAPNMLAGLSQYQTGRGGTRDDYSKSSIIDRMLTLNLKVCIPLYMMADIDHLMESYEKILGNTTNAISKGIHLVGLNLTNSLSDDTNTLDKSWRRMPCPIPPVEMKDSMSGMQKANMEYLEKRFEEALKNGIITFNGVGGVNPYTPGDPNATYEQEVFEIHDFNLNGHAGAVNRMMLEDIRIAIDEITKDQSMSEERRIEKLRTMRSGAPVRSIDYGKYLRNYANALQMTPIQPMVTDDRKEREECAKRYEKVRGKLCAYMLGVYPRCLDLVEKEFQIFEYLHEAERNLEAEIEKRQSLSRIADKYMMLFVTKKLVRKLDWFGLNYKGDFKRLFQHDSKVMDVTSMAQYPELAFVKQLETRLPEISEGLQDQIEMEIQNVPADALSLVEMKMDKEIKPQLEEKIKVWEDVLESIRDNMNMKRMEKEEMLSFYTKLLAKAKAIRDALALE